MLLNQYHVNPSQLLVGLPFYGVQFFSKELGDLFPTDGPKASSLEYYEIAPLLKKKGFKLQWDEDAQEPLLTKTKEESVVGFDNPQAISRKCQYVAEKNLPGIIIWNLGADVTGGKTPLMDAVATSFGAPKKSLPQKALTRIDSTFEDIVRGAWDSLSKLKERLANGGKNLEAKNANPGPALKPKTSLSGSRQQLAGYLEHLQNRLADLEQRTFEAKKAAAFLPLYEVAGKKPDVKGNSLLIEDFEENSNHCCGPEGWMVLADDYRLGTEVHPDPFKASPGGCPDSPGYAGHFWGHLGKGRAPNPLAELVCHFSGGQGGALTGWNLSDFTALQFWAKGDGGTYHLSLEQTCVQDGAYYGIDFTVENKWKKITLPFSQFRQSAGRPVPPHFIDARGLSFSLVNATGDVDFDLTVDQITLLK
jgi:hypothetical protein